MGNKADDEISFKNSFVVCMCVQQLLSLTPCTWAASAASLVVSAPTLFLGSSYQPRSYNIKDGDD